MVQFENSTLINFSSEIWKSISTHTQLDKIPNQGAAEATERLKKWCNVIVFGLQNTNKKENDDTKLNGSFIKTGCDLNNYLTARLDEYKEGFKSIIQF